MSTVTASFIDESRLTSLLADGLSAPVKFEQAVQQLVRLGIDTFVEVGPRNLLQGFIRQIDGLVRVLSVSSLQALEAAAAELAESNIN